MFRFCMVVAGVLFLVFILFPNDLSAQVASASIQVTVAQPQPVPAGTNFDYVIEVSSEGPDDAANATMTFPLPSGVSFQSDVIPPGWSCNSIPPGTVAPTLTCTIASLAPGTVFFTVTASTPPNASGTFSTTATVTSTTADPSDNDNTATVDVIVTPQPDYSIAIAGSPNPVNAGANLTWTMTVTNNGPSVGSTATVDLPLPPGTTFVSLSPPSGWSCSTPPTGTNGTVTCTQTGTLNVSQTATFPVVSKVDSALPAGSTISATATVTSPDDSFHINDSASASVQSAVLADPAITKTLAPAVPQPGATLQYTIVVTNNGPSDAASVTMTDVLPAALRFTSLSSPGGWSCSTPAPGANGTITCSIASLAAASNATFTLTVLIDPGTPVGTAINNTATVTSASPDSSSANNSSTASTVVATPPNVTASKSVNGGSPRPEGTVVTYTIVLTNSGTLTQPDNSGNEFTDVLPSSLTLITATATSGTAVATIGTNTVTWNGAIPGGGSVTITIQATIHNGTVGTTITNSGTVSYDSDANGTNDATRQSDDPSLPGSSDPTSFLVVSNVPALSTLMCGLLAACLAAIALSIMKK